MTTVKELLDAGQLSAALAGATQTVKAHPADAAARASLFDLLCFAGDFDRAEKQLDVIAQQGAQAEAGAQAYRHNLRAERARQRVFTAGASPKFLAEPPDYISSHLSAVSRTREGISAARALFDEAEEQRPALAGRLDNQPFQDFRDDDDFTAPVLELFMRDEYVWLPLAQVRRIELTPPQSLRDLLWATAHVETTGGLTGQFFLPVLYWGSSQHENELIKLGRMTDWHPVGDELLRACGQRLWRVQSGDGSEEKAMLEVRTIEFD